MISSSLPQILHTSVPSVQCVHSMRVRVRLRLRLHLPPARGPVCEHCPFSKGGAKHAKPFPAPGGVSKARRTGAGRPACIIHQESRTKDHSSLITNYGSRWQTSVAAYSASVGSDDAEKAPRERTAGHEAGLVHKARRGRLVTASHKCIGVMQCVTRVCKADRGAGSSLR